MKKKNNNYFVTGLKLLLLNLISGFLAWFVAIILGLSLTTIIQHATIILLIILLAMVFINGWLAQKIWKWD